MPIFEYRCSDCGAKFEKLVRGSDASEPVCPGCGKARVEKELSVFSAHNGGSKREPVGGCPAGMCATPGLCGRD